jgi:hypothetical protein
MVGELATDSHDHDAWAARLQVEIARAAGAPPCNASW